MVCPRSSDTALSDEIVFAIDEDDRPRWRKWIIVILLALLCHLLVSLYQLNWETNPSPPMQVDIHQVDPQKLEAVRKEWREKSILLDKDKSKSTDEAPKNARYMSDKNIRVEKEQRARETNVLPKAGAPGPMAQNKAQEKVREPKAPSASRSFPALGTLGVPLHLDQKPPPPPDPQDDQRGEPLNNGSEGGDQAVLDKNLPQGSQNMLNAVESVYYSFYSRMYEAIAPVWQSRIREVAPTQRVNAGDYTTVVDVVLDREGNLITVKLVHTSGVTAFDQAVDDALQKTGHFPNPPKDLLNESGEIHTGWTFTVSLEEGTGLNYLPPARVY